MRNFTHENLRQQALDIIQQAEAEGRLCTPAEMATIERLKLDMSPGAGPRRQTFAESPGAGWGQEFTGLDPSAVSDRLPSRSAFRSEADAFFSGQWVLGNIFGRQSAKQWLSRNQMHYAQSEGANAAGGALVPAPLSSAIIRLVEEYGVFRREVSPIFPMASDIQIIPRSLGGVTAAFTAENASITESDEDFDNVTLTAKKLACLTRMSTELADDAVISVANFLALEMAQAFAAKEDECGFSGDGSATDGFVRGFTNLFEADLTLVGSVDAATGNDTFSEFTMADFHSLMSVLPTYAQRGAKWFMSPAMFHGTCMRLAAASAGNTFANFSAGTGLNWLGYPVVLTSSLPNGSSTTDYSDDVVCLFGSLPMAATMGERKGLTVQNSGDRYFEQDQIAVRCTERIDINVHDIGDTSEAGPVVALIGE